MEVEWGGGREGGATGHVQCPVAGSEEGGQRYLLPRRACRWGCTCDLDIACYKLAGVGSVMAHWQFRIQGHEEWMISRVKMGLKSVIN